MKIENILNAEVFRYETASGFAVETRNSVLPFFSVGERSIYWHDFAVAPPATSLAELYSFPILRKQFQVVEFNQGGNFGTAENFGTVVTTVYGNGANTVHLDASAFASIDPVACWGSPYAVVVGTVVEDQIQLVSQCFRKYENCFVDQYQGGLLMAGKQYLIPQCEQERTEASAKDHVTHFESLILSRDHSNLKVLSTVVQELKGFGGRIWRTFLNSSNGASDCWARFLRSGQLCASFTAALRETI